jgi:nicotinate-nucleotide pyrophosphorylase (carboxylating)
MDINIKLIRPLIRAALKEDIGSGDITSNATVGKNKIAKAVIRAKQDGVIAGLDVASAVFKQIDPKIIFHKTAKDGELVRSGRIIAVVRGRARSLLAGERTALNFITRMSGIATAARAFSSRTSRYKVKILDTRKTTPGMRYLEKYAVRTGGGTNHRMGLYDMFLIKENHIKACGGITRAVKLARKPGIKTEVEVRNLDEFREALKTRADWIMLDNFNLADIKKAIKINARKKKIEISGGVNFQNVEEIAKLKPDFISVGSLTHSFRSLDISMKIV